MKTLIQLVAFLLATTAIAPSSLASQRPNPNPSGFRPGTGGNHNRHENGLPLPGLQTR